jgi:peroxisomal 2,4-dienoyl-CoA reductase
VSPLLPPSARAHLPALRAVNGIAPGPIADTPGFDKLAGMGGGDPTRTGTDPEASAAAEKVRLPRGFMAGLTWDIGMAAVFYCSTAGGYISGDIMRVDGGGHLRKGVEYPVQRDLVRKLSMQREKVQKKRPTGVAGAPSKTKSRL